MIDVYYRVQLTPEIQVGPVIEVIFDPVRHPDDDTVYVWGFRSRIAYRVRDETTVVLNRSSNR